MRSPKVLRCDALLFKLGTSYKRKRKDRDGFELDEVPPREPAVLYYEDIRPRGTA